MSDWALATTYPNTEQRVAKALAERDLPFRFFRRRKLIAHRGVLRERLIPAFPSYIFVPLIFCWDVLREIKDVVAIVMFENGKPAKVRQAVVDKLSAMCADDILMEPQPVERFRSGDRVTINSIESTVTQSATYHRSCGDGRSIVLVDWMGRSVFVSVDESDLGNVQQASGLSKRKRRRRRRNRYHSSAQASSLRPAIA